jgi:hypothetical protein
LPPALVGGPHSYNSQFFFESRLQPGLQRDRKDTQSPAEAGWQWIFTHAANHRLKPVASGLSIAAGSRKNK